MAEESKIKSGDLVRLKSGGPIMAVGGSPDNHHSYYCYWFDSNDIYHRETFHVLTLDIAEASAK